MLGKYFDLMLDNSVALTYSMLNGLYIASLQGGGWQSLG